MRISVRNPKTNSTALALFKDLLALPGDQLLLSTGFLSSPLLLPAEEIIASAKSIVLASGHWESDGHRLEDVKANAQKLVDRLGDVASRLGQIAPELRLYTGPGWHSKVAIKRVSGKPPEKGPKHTISGAIIGSSNVSERALGGNASWFNNEVDILIESTDGDDSPTQLSDLYETLALSLEGFGTRARLLSTDEKKRGTAHHEAGHALLTVVSRFFQLSQPALKLAPTPDKTAQSGTRPRIPTLQPTRDMGIEHAEIALAGKAAERLFEELTAAQGRRISPHADSAADDFEKARAALRHFAAEDQFNALIESAYQTIKAHRGAWEAIAALAHRKIGVAAELSKAEVEALPEVQQAMAAKRPL